VHLTINEINKLQIVFIVGRGRSGTSLLQTIFDANPSVKTANESPFILHLKQKYASVKNWDENKINEFIIDLYKDKKFTFLWGINPDDIKKNINLYAVSDLSFPILCKIVYLTISSPFPKEKTTLIVDKNPLYSPFIPKLIEVFPNAKFIHLIRDYRDNINSSRKAFKVKNIIVLAHRWKRYNKTIDKYKEKYTNLFYTIRYEDLVTDPEKNILEICTFLNISFNQQMSEFYDTTREAYTDKTFKNGIMAELVQQIHSNLLNPITTTQIDKWKKELSINEIELIEYITGEYAKKYDYFPSTHNSKYYFFLISWKNYVIDRFSYLVYKIYYRLPFKIRDILRIISDKLFDKLGYSNGYNEVSVRYRKK
jgi:hypothetical protein